MSNTHSIPAWKQAPLVRLLIPFIIGILLQWQLQIVLAPIPIAILCFGTAIGLFALLPLRLRYTFRWLQGINISLLVMAVGAMVSWQKDIRHRSNWYGHHTTDSSYIVVRLTEPLTEKQKSYKAAGKVEQVITNGITQPCTGQLLLYFSKDSTPPNLQYGQYLLLRNNLQAIKNSGNPGAFNYERYAAFQQFFQQSFLHRNDYTILAQTKANPFWQWLYSVQKDITQVLHRTITSQNELGIAEALLIGYKEDLDKDLVQAYSNTGVVHIIAISGLHLGLIYGLLLWLCQRLPVVKRSKGLQLVLILGCLWLFSLLTGASASVLRSAVMFTFIVSGKLANKKASMYNALAASALLLLVYDPFLLWDVGFQLSYLAVLGIVAFQQPITNWFPIRQPWLRKLWQINAVSLSAQLLTFPVCIYYFHQFPVLFLFANLIAVPLSSAILFAEIVLVAFAWIPVVGEWLGKAVGWLLWLMNKWVLAINQLPFALWDKIPATLLTTWLLYAAIICACYWLLHRHKILLKLTLCSTLLFAMLQAYGRWQHFRQQKLIVYNVPKLRAIDFVDGYQHQFIGDSTLLQDGVLQNFHLKPARVSLQLTKRLPILPSLQQQGQLFSFGGKRIVLIDSTWHYQPPAQKIPADIIIISGNPKLYIKDLAVTFDCPQYVLDATNSLWKMNYWKSDCEKLLLRCHSVSTDGAFVADIGR